MSNNADFMQVGREVINRRHIQTIHPDPVKQTICLNMIGHSVIFKFVGGEGFCSKDDMMLALESLMSGTKNGISHLDELQVEATYDYE